MNHRKLGRGGAEVSALGLGCMSLGIADRYTSSLQQDDDAIATRTTTTPSPSRPVINSPPR